MVSGTQNDCMSTLIKRGAMLRAAHPVGSPQLDLSGTALTLSRRNEGPSRAFETSNVSILRMWKFVWWAIVVGFAAMSAAVRAADEAPTDTAPPDRIGAPASIASPQPAADDAPTATGPAIAPAPAVAAGSAQPTDTIDEQLGIARHQLEMKEYTDAEPLLTNIVAELERTKPRYDPALVEPLTMLGDALSGTAQYKPALKAYEKARYITRVTNGLHTVDQVELLYREANALASMGDISKANDQEEHAYEVLLRNYGPVAPGLIPGLFRLAAWYDHTTNVFAARSLYERAVQILSRNNSATADPDLIRALRGLAYTYREERFPPFELPETPHLGALPPNALYGSQGEPMPIVNRFGPGEAALLDVVKIISADPKATPLSIALAEVDLADWYLLFDKPTRAMPVYVHARQIMRDRAAMDANQIAVYFGQPTVLYRPMPSNPSAPSEALRVNPTQGYVELGYTVTDEGEVTDLKTLSSKPEGLMDMKVRRGMRVARFRPRFDGDTPVATPNQVYRRTFTYYPKPDSTNTQKSTDHAPTQNGK